jgi:methylenetetrahydrofolate reductase (NADPH)
VPQLAVPDDVVAALERDPSAGVGLACDLVTSIRDSGAFEGVHLIPVSRYREVAAFLEARM